MVTEISAAVISDAAGRVLICRRPEGKNLALLWEFPGGKIEKGETAEECAVRECMEELDAEISVIDKFGEAFHSYGGHKVHIIFFSCRLKKGEPVNKEHAEIKWARPEELAGYDFCPADGDIIRRLSGKG